MRSLFTVSVALCLVGPVMHIPPALAMDEDKIECRQGLVYNPRTRKCEQEESLAPDDRLLAEGIALARSGSFDAAIATLWRIGDWRKNAQALNYLGLSHRKTGRLEEAFAYYRLALSVDPDYTLARSYLGEGYLAIDRPDLAEAELTEIALRAGVESAEYKALAGHLATYRAG